MAGFSSYRRVLRRPGALPFSTVGFVARLPMAMVTLGIVLLVADRTGSYQQAGTVSATFLLANAGCALVQARLIDRWGQARVLAPAVLLSTIGLAGLIAGVEEGASRTWTHACAALAGAALPQIGACVRARWVHLVDDTELSTALAYESVLDEVVFIVGPALVTVLATAVHPAAGLAFAALASAAGTAILVCLRGTQPPVTAPGRGRTRVALPWRAIAPLVACAFAMGVLLGGAEVATVAFAESRGSTGLSGVLLSVWALGSLLSGIVVGALAPRSSAATRFRRCTVALGVLVLPLPFVSSLVGVGVCLFVSGCAISPTLVAAFARIAEVVPASRMTEGITVFTTGLGAGLAPGAGVTGWAVDAAGYSAGFWVPALAGLGGAAVAVLTSGFDRRAAPDRPGPLLEPVDVPVLAASHPG
jgi:MFS family permease